jgi:fructokinase
MAEPALVIGLGEVLWDMLPSGKVLGGAPANFAYMANVLGDKGIIASRVGTDSLGVEACTAIQDLGLDILYIQRDEAYDTGAAKVTIDSSGQPNFTIEQAVAWDYLQWSPEWEELSARADVICFGSLAQRSPVSAATIDRFLANTREDALRVFDANLRQSFYTRDALCQSFQNADIVKINDIELLQLSRLFNLGTGSNESLARTLLEDFDLKLVCLTRGARGSLLVSKNQAAEHPGFRVKVADAVGAGDAFTACLVHHYIRGYSLQEISDFANRFASWVATQTGATPPVSSGQLRQILATVPDIGGER